MTDYLTLYTNWGQDDPKYFWLRGVFYGVVLATLFWKVFLPWLQIKLCRRRRKKFINTLYGDMFWIEHVDLNRRIYWQFKGAVKKSQILIVTFRRREKL